MFYMDSTACGSYNASIGTLSGTLPPTVAPPVGLYITELVDGCELTKSSAVYGDTAWKLTDRLNLDAGVRWNEDDKYRPRLPGRLRERGADPIARRASSSSMPTAVPAGFFPFPGPSCRGDRLHRQPHVRERHAAPGLRLPLHRPRHGLRELQPRLQERRVRHARQRGGLSPETENGYNSETADNYEVGIKSTLLDDTLLLNLTAFYDPYNNAQIQRAGFRRLQGRADESHRGAECRQADQPGRRVRIGVAADPAADLSAQRRLSRFLLQELSDSAATAFTYAPGCGPGVTTVNVADENRPLNAPVWNVSGNTTYTWDLASGTLLARVGYDWRSFTKVAVTPRARPISRPTGCSMPDLRSPPRARRGASRSTARTLPTDTTASLATTSALPDRSFEFLHRRREPDRLLWAAAHLYRDGDLPLLDAQRRLG